MVSIGGAGASVFLQSRFCCPTPADASPAAKARHLVHHNSRLPHCLIELTLGAQGASLSCVDVRNYQGHVPDAPMMLEPGMAERYADAHAACRAVRPRLASHLLAAAVGSLRGLAVAAASGAALAVAALLAPGLVPASLGAFVAATGALCVTSGAHAGIEDHRQWKRSATTFAQMAALAAVADRLRQDGPSEELCLRARQLCDDAMGSSSYPVQHAALELEAKLPK